MGSCIADGLLQQYLRCTDDVAIADADSSAVVHSEGVQQDATKSRILLLLGTQ